MKDHLQNQNNKVMNLFYLKQLLEFVRYNMLSNNLLFGAFVCIITLISSGSSHPEMTFSVKIVTKRAIVAQANLEVIYSKYAVFGFRDTKKHSKLGLLKDLGLVTCEQIEISSKETLEYSIFKLELTKFMVEDKRFSGLEDIFAVNHVLTNTKINKTKELTSNIVYLKIHLNESMPYGNFYINQDLFLSRSDFKPIQSYQQQMFKLRIIPQLFTASDEMIDIVEFGQENYKILQQYYLKASDRDQHQKLLQYAVDYFESSSKMLDDKKRQLIQKKQKTRLTSEQESTLKLLNSYQYQQQFSSEVNIMKSMSNSNFFHQIYSQTIIITSNLLFEVLQVLKKYVFFNENNYYSLFVVLFSIFSLLYPIASISFSIVVWQLTKNFRKHIGISMVFHYLLVLSIVLSFHVQIGRIFEYLIWIIPLFSIYFATSKSFPYFKLQINQPYRKYLEYEKFIGIVIFIITFVLFLGTYLFYFKIYDHNVKQKQYLLELNTSTLLLNILNEYFYFFVLLGQLYVNYKLESVKHLTGWYVILYFILAVSDDYEILIKPHFFFILLRLKQQILFVILFMQCQKYGDIGKGTFNQVINQQIETQFERRKKQLQGLRIQQSNKQKID